MTIINLIDDLASYLQEKFAGWTLPGKTSDDQRVKIFKGFLPEPRGVTVKGKASGAGPDDYISNFPCIVIEFSKLTDDEERSRKPTVAEVRLTACAYDRNVVREIVNAKSESEDEGNVASEVSYETLYDNTSNQGWADPLIMLEHARLWLQNDRYIGHGDKKYFHLLPPLTITNGPVQEFPTYSAEMQLRFELYRPAQDMDWSPKFYGLGAESQDFSER